MTLTFCVGSGSRTSESRARYAKSAQGFQLITEFFVAEAETITNPISFGFAVSAMTWRMASTRSSNVMAWSCVMERTAYNRRSWRDLPRDYCLVEHLFGAAAGPCFGLIAHHHIDPTDEDSRTVQCCNSHHQHLHKALRALTGGPERARKRCRHTHRSREAREACERRLSRVA